MTDTNAYPDNTPLSEYAKNPILSVRARNLIEKINRDQTGLTVGDLKRYSFDKLMRNPRAGPITCSELCKALGIAVYRGGDPEVSSRYAAAALQRLGLDEDVFMSCLRGESALSTAKRLRLSRSAIILMRNRIAAKMKRTLVLMPDTRIYDKRNWDKLKLAREIAPATKEVFVEWQSRFLNYRKTLQAQARKHKESAQRKRPNGADVMEFACKLSDAELVSVVRAWGRRDFSPYIEQYQAWRNTNR